MDMHEEELKLEREALSHGILRYNNNLKIRGATDTQPGQRAMRAAVEPLAAAIREKLAEGNKARKRASILPKLNRIAPETLALITVRVVMQAVTERKIQNATARLIGAMVSEHDDWSQLRKTDKGLAVKAERQLKKYTTEELRRRVASHIVLKHTEHGHLWSDKEQMTAGAWLLEMLVTYTQLAEIAVSWSARRKRRTHHVQATAETEKLLRDGHARCEVLDPIYMPMVVKPLAWSHVWDGGYLQRRIAVVKTFNREHLVDINAEGMPQVYSALNSLQNTAYRINKSVLGVLTKAWAENAKLPDMPDQEPEPLPAKPHDIADNEESRNIWKRQAAQVHQQNAKVRGKRVGVMSKLNLATKLQDYPAIYFPHTMDWRGRVYPVPIYIQPQGDDIGKSLLQFAEGKPLGEEGVLWLKVHIANLFGVDKVSFGERIQWVDDNLQHLLGSGMDPWEHAYWLSADKPWQALAACFELVGWSVMGADYVSHLPIAMDGSCNGLQHLSAMLKDEVGGKATNLIPSEKPSDIYTQVADRTIDKLKSIADPESWVKYKGTQEENEEVMKARKWLALGVPRKLVKRPVMTRPYGVTPFGMRDQMMGEARAQGLFETDDDVYPMTTFLAPIVNDAINEIVVGSKEVMNWLQECARVSAVENLPLSWTTPIGFRVLQDYRKMKGTEAVAAIGGIRSKFRLNVHVKDLDRKKQGLGMSPNVIHSYDASHMMATVNRCVEAGIESLAMVHDSYATHASDVGEMNTLLRQAFVEMYSGDVLQDLYAQFISQVGESVELPAPPAIGNLDLSSVEESLYFFA